MKLYEITHKEVVGSKSGWWEDKFKDWFSQNYFFGGKEGRSSDSPISQKAYDDVHDYVYRDKAPSGPVGKSMEEVIAVTDPIPNNFLSYRGLNLPSETLDEILSAIKGNGTYEFKSNRPSSWTTSKRNAWDFVKTKGHRKTAEGSVPVILEAQIPSGTKIGVAPFTFDIANEHWLSKNTQITIHRARKYREGIILQGKAN